MSTPDKRIPLPHVSRAIAARTGQIGPLPRKIYELALMGAFPAENIRGRWYVREADLPLVIAALPADSVPVAA
jgi:hypothetical protein